MVVSNPVALRNSLSSGVRTAQTSLLGFLSAARKAIRAIQLAVFVALFPYLRGLSRKKWVFNLDCHVSVIADIRMGLAEVPDVKLISWSLSKHNFVFRSFFTEPDPVYAIDSDNWSDLTEERIQRFLRRYQKFLRCFDGFIVTYPIGFVRLFSSFGKPILAVSAIRYEHPFGVDAEGWQRLDGELRELHDSGKLLLVANNRGDAEYASHFLERPLEIVPSVCDYIALDRSPGPSVRIVQSRSKELEKEIATSLGDPWVTARDYFGKRYSWELLSQVDVVLYVPYVTSTMTLFELATLGIPTLIPTGQLLDSLARDWAGVVSELSFRTKLDPLVHPKEQGFPGADQRNPGFVQWWLERADFADAELMPNVRLVEHLSDPIVQESTAKNFSDLASATERRNRKLQETRLYMLKKFRSLL